MGAGTSAKDLFNEALERPTEERAAFLDEACGGDQALRARVERLLAAHERHAAFLLSPTGVAGDASPPPGEGPGAQIGRYRLLQLIGEGGFGSVFMAEQREPVARRVALKIIKLGMDTRQVIARFEAERQALAMMDHPGIAKVLDAGATESGRPYFVMELVRGEPITAYCDHAAMDIRGRLELFQQVCHAVQHAHQKGIIHRDLKPSNILVGEIDGKPAPKIIDFGIAKATGGAGALTDKTLFTDFRQFVGTPEYMSPEQAGMGAVDIDTRSDIYSLGVLLYELLTGGPPFDARKLRSAAWEEMRRIIREDEPQRPSTRLHSREDTQEVAARRKMEPARLIGLVRGDLDWIAMKCLEKDRARRYETANGLAMDIERHLRDEPVVAGPPRATYRLRKFIRRRRGPVIAAALGAAMLIAGTALSTSLWMRASEAEEKATSQLWESHLAQSRLRRHAPEMGRRFDSLEIIRRAAAIRPSLEVRNEAIAALALLDAREINATPELPLPTEVIYPPVSDRVLVAGAGRTEIRRITDYALIGAIPRRVVPTGWIYSSSFSADGTRLALRAFDDGGRVSVSVWDFPDIERRLEVEADGDFALSPEGDLLAVVGGGVLRMLRLPDGTELWRQGAPGNCFLYFRPGHHQLGIVREFAARLRLLDVYSGEEMPACDLPGSVGGMSWSHDGARLALGCADLTVRVGKPEHADSWIELEGHQGQVTELSFDPTGELLLSDAWDSTARIWDLPLQRCLLVLPSRKAWPSQSPSHLLGLEHRKPRNYRFQRFELARSDTFRRLAAFDLGAEPTDHPFLTTHPTLGVIATGFAGGTHLAFWDPAAGTVLGAFEIGPLSHAEFSPAGDALYTTGERGLEVRAVTHDAATLRLSPPRSLNAGWRSSFDIAAGGSLIAALPEGSRAEFTLGLDRTGSDLQIPLPCRAIGVHASPDGRYAAFSTWHDPDVALWDRRAGLIQPLGLELPGHARFSEDGRWLLAATWGEDHIFNTADWSMHARIQVPDASNFPGRGSFSHDGSLYARVISTHGVRLVRTDTFTEVATLEAPDLFGIYDTVFTADDSEVVALTNRGHVMYAWNLPVLRRELRSLGLDWQPDSGEDNRAPRPCQITSVVLEPP